MSALGDIVAWFSDDTHWSGPDGVPTRVVEHLELTAAGVVIACLIALPLALWLGHTGRGGVLAVNISNVGRGVPTFAVLVLLAIGPLGFGAGATTVSLVLFGVPPILTNAYVGMREVDRDIVEAARGMGMDGWQLLRRVELPLAVPLVMTGVRLAAVQIVATATIAALVAGGGLGRIISAGFGRQNQAQVVAGALLVVVLALLVEAFFAGLSRVADPVRRARRSRGGARPLPEQAAGSLSPA